MRMRTYPLVLVQLAGLIYAAAALAQSGDYGADGSVTHGSVPKTPATRAERPSQETATAANTPTRPATPPRGMPMDAVRAGYGAPRIRHAAVGQPPITRWDYPGYRLYFEYNHVLHAVVPGAPEPVAHAEQLTQATP